MGLVQVRRVLAVVAFVAGSVPLGNACFYSSFDFSPDDPSQSKLGDLLTGAYDEEPAQKRLREFHTRLGKIEPDAKAPGAPAELKDEYALLLYRLGRAGEAELIWKEMLKAEPGRFATLANYGTALETMGRYEEGLALLEAAATERPDFRGGAERLHAMRSRALLALRKGGKQEENFFMPELVPVWAQRAKPPEGIAKVEIKDRPVDGVVELLHQFPEYGEGWFALGILLENSGDFRRAAAAYRRAVRHGIALRKEVDQHLILLKEYEESRGSFADAAPSVAYLFGSLAALFLLWKYGPVARDVVVDLRKAAHERRNPPDNHGR